MIRITIEGPTGSGKTRIAHAIMDFVEVRMKARCVIRYEAKRDSDAPDDADVFISEIQTTGDGR